MSRSNNPRTAVAYIRVSTDDQRNGPEAQRAAIEAWAAREGVHVAAWHVDHGVSGATPVAQRPGLVEALASLRAHRAGVLVAAKRDRIARDVAVADSVAKMAAKEGATVRTVDGMSDASGSAGMIQRGVSDLFAAYEREVIRERTTAALAVKKAKGECVGRVPFGFRLAADGVHLEPDADEQTIVARVRELAAQGMSRRAIVAELAARGVVSRVGKPLQITQVARILAAA
jgi:DNA invertase Pin-like site-specific DNA recombinase